MSYTRAPSRLRMTDLRELPLAVWVLLAMAVIHLMVRFSLQAPSSAGLFVGMVTTAAPYVFAAAVIYMAPGRRFLVAGALALVAAELLVLARPVLLAPALLDFVLELVSRLSRLVGPFLLAAGVGGLITQRGWLLVVIALGIAAGKAGWVFATAVPELPTVELAMSVVLQLTIVGWAYLLAAALDRGLNVLATGAALMLLLDAMGIAFLFLPSGPETDFELLLLLFGVVTLAAWAALTMGALRDLRRPVFLADDDADDDAEAGAGVDLAAEEADAPSN